MRLKLLKICKKVLLLLNLKQISNYKQANIEQTKHLRTEFSIRGKSMSIRAIEDSIIKRLKADFPDLFVDGFPEKPQEFTLIHPIGALLVHYRGGNYSD